MIARRTARLMTALAAAVALTACGSDSTDDTATPEQVTPPAVEETTAAQQECEPREPNVQPPQGLTADLKVQPKVPASDQPPPCGLVKADVVVGTGAEATIGTQALVKYVGAFYDSGEEFDSSWSRGADETLPLKVGGQMVIPGFDQGVAGMKVGGRRYVVIPSDLGYGEQGQGPIPGGATLVFVIDLVEVN